MTKTYPSLCYRMLGAAWLCWLLAPLASSAARQEDFPGQSAKWRHYQSPHFEMFSATRDLDSRELLHNLELLRALFFETFKVKERQPMEVTVYYFNEEKAFKAYSPMIQRQSLAGYYLYRPDRAVIAISPSWSDESQRYVIFHEFIHHLNRAVATDPPLWYNEGVAELLSTIEVEKKHVTLGAPLPWHIDTLRSKELLPLDTLFAVDQNSPIYNTGKHSGLFYAESWALMHFTHFGNSKLDKGKMDMFLQYLLNEPPGADPATRRIVFKDLLGIDYPELEKMLATYLSRGSFTFREAALPQIPGMESYTQRNLGFDEISTRLAELSLRVTQSPTARLFLLDAAGKSPANTRCWEALGSDAWSLGDFDVAQERWQRAVDGGTNNPAVFHELGQMEGRKWFERFDYYFLLPEARARQLRSLLRRSIECAPEQFAAYETLAWVEASVTKPDIANINLVQQHFKSLRQKARTVLALALVRVRVDDPAAALKLLDQLDKMHPDYQVAVSAETLRAKLEDREPRRIAPPATAEAARPRIFMQYPELPK